MLPTIAFCASSTCDSGADDDTASSLMP